MWVDVWGAKVTRRYVPVIARVPPVIERAERVDEKIIDPCNLDHFPVPV